MIKMILEERGSKYKRQADYLKQQCWVTYTKLYTSGRLKNMRACTRGIVNEGIFVNYYKVDSNS